jgi:Tfp pilus assembly protein PilN
MKPVNLIPAEDRRGVGAPMRTGSAVYIVVGALAAILVAVCAVVFLGNKAADKQTEVAALESQAAETQARADGLSSYVSFQEMRDSRVETIDSLATSRFDWERVIRELSIVIPRGIWLSNLTGTVGPEVQLDDGAAIGLRSSIPGPALELVGCARSQPSIARLIAAMHDIDGVTRVTAANGIKPSTADEGDTSSSDAASSDAATTTGACPRSAPRVERGAAIDAVAVPDAATAPVPAEPTTTAEATSTPSDPSVTAEQQSVADADSKAKKATNLIPGG